MSKNEKAQVHVSNQESERIEIPFVKPARAGNFKFWRSKKSIGIGKEKSDIEQINISTLDGTWQVKIPSTFQMYGLIVEIYKSAMDKKSSASSGQAMNQLITLFGNMLYASVIANGHFHRAMNMLVTVYSNPGLLKEDDKNHASFMQDVKEVVDRFLVWREEFDRHASENAPTEEEQNQAEVADEVRETLQSSAAVETD